VPAGYVADILSVPETSLDGVEQGAGGWVYEPATGKLKLARPVSTATDLVATVVFWPRLACANYPDWLLARHGAAIAAGAQAILKGMAGRPWSDPQGAAAKQLEFDRAIGEAKSARWTGHTGGTLAIQPGMFV
jgi:hypothetical protein